MSKYELGTVLRLWEVRDVLSGCHFYFQHTDKDEAEKFATECHTSLYDVTAEVMRRPHLFIIDGSTKIIKTSVPAGMENELGEEIPEIAIVKTIEQADELREAHCVD